jgi:hypothetical protein
MESGGGTGGGSRLKCVFTRCTLDLLNTGYLDSLPKVAAQGMIPHRSRVSILTF